MKHRPGTGDSAPARGAWGEDYAAAWLARNKRYRILAKRVRLDRRNELDIIARDRDTLVFVEVKTRKSEDFGRPVDSVDRAKRAHLSRAAMRYVSRLRQPPAFIRFDVVEITGGEDCVKLNHIENAFPLETPYRPAW